MGKYQEVCYHQRQPHPEKEEWTKVWPLVTPHLYDQSFLHATIPVWNSLPNEVVNRPHHKVLSESALLPDPHLHVPGPDSIALLTGKQIFVLTIAEKFD